MFTFYNDTIGEMSKLNGLNFDDWEQLIRSGRGGQVREQIAKVKDAKLSRNETLKVANYARRVGLASVAINLLRAFVRTDVGIKNNASSEEKSEYAAALIREGVVGEGLKLLKDVDATAYPEALLYSSFGLFTRWDYEASLPLLQKYVKLAPNDYQRILGNINLVASLIFTKNLDEADDLLKKLINQTQQEQFRLSHSYCLELYGQFYIQQKDYKKAREYFNRAGSLSANSATSMPFLSRKWLAITDLLEASDLRKNALSAKDLKQFYSVKEEALRIKDFETVRTCDLHLAVCKHDKALAKHVYFGSAHRKFRESVAAQVSHFTDIPEHYDQIFGGLDRLNSKDQINYFDMHEGAEVDGEAKLKNNQAMHRVFQIIASDFYKPVRATEIFSLAFPNEYFDQSVSINRVHQVVKRLRVWLEESEVPLRIVEHANTYKIESESAYAIRWTDRQQVFEKNYIVNKLQKEFKNKLFKLNDAALSLNMPSRSASRVIKKAIDEGYIERSGGGHATLYKIKSKG